MSRLRADNQWLDGPQRAALRKCLVDAFDTTSFAQMLFDRLSKRLDLIVTTYGLTFEQLVDRTIQKADEQSWTADLLAAAQAERPADPCLAQFAQQLAAPPGPTAPGQGQTQSPPATAPSPSNVVPRQPSRSVVWLAFANDHGADGRFLPHLRKETRELQKLWEPVDNAARCTLLLRPSVTIDDLLSAYQDHRNQIALFHFGGHGSSDELLLESVDAAPAVANAGGLAKFLAGQAGLQLALLNACSTKAQAEALHAAGVPVVIATSRDIDDGVAVELATWFHRALVSGASIHQAFDETAGAVKTAHGDNLRNLYSSKMLADAQPSEWPWAIYVRPGAEAAADWALQAAQVFAASAMLTAAVPPPASLRTTLFDLLANAPGMESPDARRGLLNYIGFGYLTQVLDLTGAPLTVASRLVATIAGSGKTELSRFLVGLQTWQGLSPAQQVQLAAMAQVVVGLSEGEVKAEFTGVGSAGASRPAAPSPATRATLTPERYAAIETALLDAFRREAELRMMVRLRLGENLDAIAGGENLSQIVFNLVEWADANGRVAELIAGAQAQNPGNQMLRAL